MYVLVISGLLLSALQLSFMFYFNDRIKKDLQDEVYRRSHGEYKLKIGYFNTNLFLQSVYAGNFLLEPRQDVNPLAPKVYVSAEAMDLEDFEIMPWILNRDIIFSHMELLHPQSLIYRGDVRHEKPKQERPFVLYDLFKKFGRSIYVHRIYITDADMRFYDSMGAQQPFISSRENHLYVAGLFINGGVAAKGRMYTADRLAIDMRNFSFKSSNGRYTMKVKKLWASYFDSTLIVDSMRLIPNFPNGKFEQFVGRQVDRFSGDIAKLTFKGMDLKLFLERNAFIARDMQLDRMNIQAYRNKNMPRLEKIQPSLQQIVRDIPFYVNIGYSHMHAVNLIYDEVPEGFSEAERVIFSNLSGEMRGFTNDEGILAANSTLSFSGTGMFMGLGYSQVSLDFPMGTTECVFHCKGSIVKMPFETFNPVVEKSSSIRIKKGYINSMSWDFDAEPDAAEGEMLLLYNGLKVEVLDENAEKTKKLKTFVANAFVVIDDNPMPNEAPRKSPIHYERDPTRFIFNYMLHSIISGVKPAVGMNKEIRQLDRKLTKEERKAKRMERREKRRQKKNENAQR